MSKRYLFIVVLSLVFMLCLSGCPFQNDFYADKRPAANDHEIWICEEPPAYFIWSGDEGGHGHNGEIILGNTLYEYAVLFDYGTGADLIVLNEYHTDSSRQTALLQADCKFSKNKVVMKIQKNDHFIYSNDYDEIIFERREFDPEKDELPTLSANGN